MKIKLPHKIITIKEEHKLYSNEEKVNYVNEILNEKFTLRNEKITVEEFFYSNFNNQSTIVALDMLSYYITKEHKVKQDILTRETVGKMQKGDGRTVNFSNLGYNENLKLGIVDDMSEASYN